MAHFAEIDSNNIVLRVLTADSNDVTNNGGDQSEAAATHFQSLVGLSTNGVKYVQTSGDGSFRKNFASIDFTYDAAKNAFIPPKKHPSWVLDETTCRYIPPVAMPETFNTHASDATYVDDEGNPLKDRYWWNEETVSWDSVG